MRVEVATHNGAADAKWGMSPEVGRVRAAWGSLLWYGRERRLDEPPHTHTHNVKAKLECHLILVRLKLN